MGFGEGGHIYEEGHSNSGNLDLLCIDSVRISALVMFLGF